VRHAFVGVHLDFDAGICQSLGVSKAIISENIVTSNLDYLKGQID
jgi:hypothetical protein